MELIKKTNFAFIHPPEDFYPCTTVVSLMCWKDGKCLFLQKSSGYQKDRWGLPGGKVNRWEDPLCAMQRELIEETGIFIPIANMEELGQVYMRTQMDYKIHVFSTNLEMMRNVYISKEHKDYKWLTIKDALHLSLLIGQDEILSHFSK